MKRIALLLTLIALTACTSPAPTPNADPNAITLLSPSDGAVFPSAADVVLEWSWGRDLSENQHFDLRVWRDGDPNYGITWTDESSFSLVDWLLTREPGEYLWSVAVIEGDAEGNVIAEPAPQPAPFRFTVEAIELPVTAMISVPDGFEVTEYATIPVVGGGSITAMQFLPDGSIAVLTYTGQIYIVDPDSSVRMIFANTPSEEGDDPPLKLSAGLAVRDGIFYVSDSGRVSRLDDTGDDGILDKLTVLVEGLPSWLYVWHSNNGIAFDEQGRLYITVGAASDHGPVTLDYEGSILRMDADGSNLEVFASGFRNPYDLVFSPNGDLFATDNGPDYGPEDLPEDRRVEELNHVREGLDYGFPDVFGIVDGADSEPPVAELIPHSATSGVTYYAGSSLPFPEGVFIAQWGATEGEINRQVIFVPLELGEDGRYHGEWQLFASFMNGARPVDVVIGPDGALYIAEFTRGIIMRVAFIGG